MAEVAEMLKGVPLFAGVKDRDLGRLAKVLSERTFAEGDAITIEGQSGVGFFVIEHGNATVSLKGEIIRTLGPGDHIGEIADRRGPALGHGHGASTDLRCRGMAAWEFRSFVQEHPEVAWALLQTLASRFRETQARACGLTTGAGAISPLGAGLQGARGLARIPRVSSPPSSQPVRAAW